MKKNIIVTANHIVIYDAIPYGLVARISGSHPGGPGSIPGMGKLFC